MHTELKDLGVACGRKQMARLMREAGLVGVSPRHSKATTILNPPPRPPSIS